MMYSMEFYSHLYINYLMFIYTKFLELIFNLLLLTILSPKRDIFLLCQIIYVFEVFVSKDECFCVGFKPNMPVGQVNIRCI